MKHSGFPITISTSTIQCEVFEDNSKVLTIENNHKYAARTKHLNVKLRYFKDYVSRRKSKVSKIGTKSQQSDYLTKLVNFDY